MIEFIKSIENKLPKKRDFLRAWLAKEDLESLPGEFPYFYSNEIIKDYPHYKDIIKKYVQDDEEIKELKERYLMEERYSMEKYIGQEEEHFKTLQDLVIKKIIYQLDHDQITRQDFETKISKDMREMVVKKKIGNTCKMVDRIKDYMDLPDIEYEKHDILVNLKYEIVEELKETLIIWLYKYDVDNFLLNAIRHSNIDVKWIYKFELYPLFKDVEQEMGIEGHTSKKDWEKYFTKVNQKRIPTFLKKITLEEIEELDLGNLCKLLDTIYFF